jgi:hypothetical protein
MEKPKVREIVVLSARRNGFSPPPSIRVFHMASRSRKEVSEDKDD